ncbi:hypothetical protein GCM10009416_05480 [Craurococcus roseus]|uniref:Uncharacterized protein n=1 Tax=Craurococcus roseus TaxID=77585 RepID=A0ABP3PL72_9PROT
MANGFGAAPRRHSARARADLAPLSTPLGFRTKAPFGVGPELRPPPAPPAVEAEPG